MSHPFQSTPSPSSFPNTSQPQQGNAPLYNIPISNYPPIDPGLDGLPELPFSQAWELNLSLDDPELLELSSLFDSAGDSSLPLGSSQTSQTDPNWEPYPPTTGPIQSQDVPVDPVLVSGTFNPPKNQASAESVSNMGFHTQAEAHQQGFLKPPNPHNSSGPSLAESTKRTSPLTNNVGKVIKRNRQRRLVGRITRGPTITPESSVEDVTIEHHRLKRRRLSNDNAQIGTVTNDPDVSQRAESFLRHWVSQTPDRGPTRKEMANLADLTECSFKSVHNWFKENGNISEVLQLNPCDDEEPPNIVLNVHQDPECTCTSSYLEGLCWRRAREPDKPYSCTHRCGRNFNKRGGWERHERSNWGGKVWKCPRCPKIFKRRDKLGSDGGHLKTVHKIYPTDEILRNACQSNEELFWERCGFCGKALEGWKTYINHVGGHFADETVEPRWHMSVWRRPWTDAPGTMPPGDDDDDDDNNDDGGSGGNDYKGYNEHQNGDSNTGNGHHPGRPNGPNSRSSFFGNYGSRSTYSTGRQCYISLNSTGSLQDSTLSYRDHSGQTLLHRLLISPFSNLRSRPSIETFQQLLIQRSVFREKSIGKFLNFYDPFEHTLCSAEVVCSHWMEQLERFMEDMQSILPNELWTGKDSRLEFDNRVWRPIMPPISMEGIFFISWLPLYGDLHITIRMTVSLVWTKIARLHVSRPLLGNRTYTTDHISDPLWPSPLEICKSPFAKFSNSLQQASSSEQSFAGLSGFYEEDLAESESERWNGASNGLDIHGQLIASNSVGSAVSLVSNRNGKGTKLFVLCWLYVLLVDLPHRMPNPEEIKFLALLRRASDHAIISWIQDKVSPAIGITSEGTTFPTTAIAPRSDHSSVPDVTCIATQASAYLQWNKPRDPTRPYSCTKKCGWSFRKKGGWIKHETINLSREKWTCAQCQLCFTRLADSRDHFDQVHQHPANSLGNEDLRSHATVTFSEACGFCGHRCGSWKQWTNHVGAHFENRIKGGPWVMSRWVHPWVCKDHALCDDFESYEGHDRNDDMDDDHGAGDPGNGDGRRGGSSATGSCSDPGRGESESTPGPKPQSPRRETQGPETSQGFSLWPRLPKTPTHPVLTAPDVSDPTFSRMGNPQGGDDFNEQSADRTTFTFVTDRSSGDSLPAHPANPIIDGLELFEEPADLLPDPMDISPPEAVSTLTSSVSNIKGTQDDRTRPARYITPFLIPPSPDHTSPHVEIDLISIPLPSFIRTLLPTWIRKPLLHKEP